MIFKFSERIHTMNFIVNIHRKVAFETYQAQNRIKKLNGKLPCLAAIRGIGQQTR